MYSLKALAWASYLPLYRQCILRSGLIEEVQVHLLVFVSSGSYLKLFGNLSYYSDLCRRTPNVGDTEGIAFSSNKTHILEKYFIPPNFQYFTNKNCGSP